MSIKRTFYGTTNEITFRVDKYMHGGGLAVIMECEDGPYGVLTVNLEDFPTYGNKAFVDVNNNGTDIIDWIESNNLGTVTSRMGFSGFCVYPEVEFNLDEINKHLTEGVLRNGTL